MANPFHPERFQGSLRRRDYFEGWYFKLSDHAGARGLAVIAGVALGGPGQAFVQVLEGEGHSSFTAQWPLQAFHTAHRRFAVEIADNHFDGDGLALHIDQNGHSLRGTLRFLHPTPFSGTGWPGIMGPYGFLPGMECSHAVVSIRHTLEGALTLDGRTIDFTGGIGYTEKDWGVSFPRAWAWVHADRFGGDETFLFSVADIPQGRRTFPGFFAFLYRQGQCTLFATYNRSRLENLTIAGNDVQATIGGPAGRLCFHAEAQHFGVLAAPRLGRMERPIEESLSARVDLTLTDPAGSLLFAGASPRAGMERCGALALY